MGTLTPIYGFFKPDSGDSMADVKKNINDNFRLMQTITRYDSVATLPVFGGGASVGKVVYLNDVNYQSLFICVVADPDWGAHWRPIQAPLSPFVNVPNTAVIDTVNYLSNMKIRYDNQGMVYWKGNLQYLGAGGWPKTGPQQLLKNLPKGLRPCIRSTFACVSDPQQTVLLPPPRYQGGHFFLGDKSDLGVNNMRVVGGASGVEKFLFVDGVAYPAGEGNFVTA